jgi:hypothetical protein
MHEEILTRSSIYVVQSLNCSSGFRCLVTSTDFGPCFLKNLDPHLSSRVLHSNSVFVPCKAELLNSLLISVEWEPIVHDNFEWLSVNSHLNTVDSSSIHISCQEVVSDSEALLLVSNLGWIFSKASHSC